MVKIKSQDLQDLVRDIFVAAGCSTEEGGRVGKYLVGANLAGHDSHGVARVLRYVQMKRDGAIVADQKVDVVIDTPVLAVVDGLYGDYQPAGPRNYRQGTGAIRAFGDHKGSGLALMCELIGGALTGTGASMEGRRFANGMFSVYVDPTVIDPEAFFPGEVARYVAFVKSARPVAPDGEVLVPGEPEARTRKERLAGGIPLPDDTWGAIGMAAREVGLNRKLDTLLMT